MNDLWKDALAHVDVHFTPKEQAMIDRIKKEKAGQPDQGLTGRPAGGRRPEPEEQPKEQRNQRSSKMKNKAIDLHNILFEELERLNDLDEDEMKSEKLANEIRRAEAINQVAAQLVSNGRLVLDSMKFSVSVPEEIEMPEMLSAPETKPNGRK
jgi:glycine/D-amino acid oxidase-like deaminating enzyme